MPRVSVKEAAAVIVALAVIGVAKQVWPTAQSGYQSLTALTRPGPSKSERELGSLFDERLRAPMFALRQIVPRNVTFAVRVGLTPPVDSSFLAAVPPLFTYLLLPRRYTEHAHEADWVITFNHPASTLGVPIRRQFDLGDGVGAVEVAR